MAHKTKKQKIQADQRRELAVSYSYSPSSHSAVTTTAKSVNKPSILDATDIAYVKKDLVKIALLSTIAICAQVVLWYLLESNFVKFF